MYYKEMQEQLSGNRQVMLSLYL